MREEGAPIPGMRLDIRCRRGMYKTEAYLVRKAGEINPYMEANPPNGKIRKKPKKGVDKSGRF